MHYSTYSTAKSLKHAIRQFYIHRHWYITHTNSGTIVSKLVAVRKTTDRGLLTGEYYYEKLFHQHWQDT